MAWLLERRRRVGRYLGALRLRLMTEAGESGVSPTLSFLSIRPWHVIPQGHGQQQRKAIAGLIAGCLLIYSSWTAPPVVAIILSVPAAAARDAHPARVTQSELPLHSYLNASTGPASASLTFPTRHRTLTSYPTHRPEILGGCTPAPFDSLTLAPVSTHPHTTHHTPTTHPQQWHPQTCPPPSRARSAESAS